MDFASFLSGIRFRLFQPEDMLRPWMPCPSGVPPARLLRRRAIFAVLNTRLPACLSPAVRMGLLRLLATVPNMCSLPIAAFLQHAVRMMPPDQAYVNVGTWYGCSLFAGMLGNPGKRCIGVDICTFPQIMHRIPPFRDELLTAFERRRSPSHAFHEMDYEEYFTQHHRGPIGVYFYDGDHAYEHQRRGLEIAEPFFADGCVILIDDTNWEEPRRATLDFLATRRDRFELVADLRTADNMHPTWWNGLMVLRRKMS